MGAQRSDLRRLQTQPRRRRGRTNSTDGPAPQGGQAAAGTSRSQHRFTWPWKAYPRPPAPRAYPGSARRRRTRPRRNTAGVPGRIGERLDRQHDLVVQVQVVSGQPGQRPGQHRRGHPGRPPGSTQNRCWPASIGSRSRRSVSDQPIAVSRAVHRSTADPYPKARPRRRPAPRRAGPPTRTGARRASGAPPGSDRTGPSQRVAPAVPSDRGSMRPRPESCQLPARMSS